MACLSQLGINLVEIGAMLTRSDAMVRKENIKNHSGLGLSIAREIIEHMNGNISLDKSNKSDYPGACFLITLPIKQ